MRRALATALVLAGLLPGALGCGSLQKAADQDPMKCERDAKCNKKRTRSADCSEQCSDDPACMSRCEQIQAPNGGLGH